MTLVYVDMDGVLCDYKGAWNREKQADQALVGHQPIRQR
jgi:hypothetical protein